MPVSDIKFIKAQGMGNDFLIIDQKFAPADIARFTRRICDRHTGVGADGSENVGMSNELCMRETCTPQEQGFLGYDNQPRVSRA